MRRRVASRRDRQKVGAVLPVVSIHRLWNRCHRRLAALENPEVTDYDRLSSHGRSFVLWRNSMLHLATFLQPRISPVRADLEQLNQVT